MTASAALATGTGYGPASRQTSVPADQLLHSANAGLLIHRVGQLRHEFRDEGGRFSADLVELINRAQLGFVSIFGYDELFGIQDRVHWLLHLKQPNDYGRMLEMVDHSQPWQEVSGSDRLAGKGGGNWERMFVEGSMRETVICPQHGLGQHADGGHPGDTFQPPAMYQSTVPAEQLLTSVNSAITIHRVGQVRYARREEARRYWFAWCGYVSAALPGRVSAYLYEEMWGQQDRLHLLIHLRSLADHDELLRLAAADPGYRELQAQRWMPGPGSGAWHEGFVDGTIHDSVWAARTPARG